jgi:hypothetical protein
MGWRRLLGGGLGGRWVEMCLALVSGIRESGGWWGMAPRLAAGLGLLFANYISCWTAIGVLLGRTGSSYRL